MLQPTPAPQPRAFSPLPPTAMPLMAAQGWREATRLATLRALLGKPWTSPPVVAAHLRANGWDATCAAQGLRVEGYLMTYRPKLGWGVVAQGPPDGDRRVYVGCACLRLLLAARAWSDDEPVIAPSLPALPARLLN